MTTFLFWNIKRKPLESIITRLCLEHEVDMLMLAECNIEPDALRSFLTKFTGSRYYYISKVNCEKIKIFTRFPEEFILPRYDDRRMTIQHLKLPDSIDILLSVIHFIDKLNYNEDEQYDECIDISEIIKEQESIIGHSRTVFVGDLNMSPFEEGVIKAKGFQAVMSQEIAQRRTRTVKGREYPFFYNPMWNLLGDTNSMPPGTYYDSKKRITLFWYMFDQVLIRPDLLDRFDNQDLQIIDSVNNTSLLSSNRILNDKSPSDHLPLLFRLNLRA
jgi:hypothetical protein